MLTIECAFHLLSKRATIFMTFIATAMPLIAVVVHYRHTNLRSYSGRALRYGWKVSGPSKTLKLYSLNKFGPLPPAKELVHRRRCLYRHNTLPKEGRRNVLHQWRAMAEEDNHHPSHLRSSSILALWRLGKLRPVIILRDVYVEAADLTG